MIVPRLRITPMAPQFTSMATLRTHHDWDQRSGICPPSIELDLLEEARIQAAWVTNSRLRHAGALRPVGLQAWGRGVCLQQKLHDAPEAQLAQRLLW